MAAFDVIGDVHGHADRLRDLLALIDAQRTLLAFRYAFERATDYSPPGNSDNRTCVKERFIETLPEGSSHAILNVGMGPNDDTPVFTVPAGIEAGESLFLSFTVLVSATLEPASYCNSRSPVH